MTRSQTTAFHVAKERGDLLERAKAEAEKRRRSLSWLICEAIEEYLRCPVCDGTGSREVQRGRSGYAVEDVECVCSACGGTGKRSQ